MVEIKRKLNYTDVNYGLIQFEKPYRDYFPKAGENVIVEDKDGQRYYTHMHRGGQPRIDGLTKLLKKYNATEGDILTIQINLDNNSQILVDINKEDIGEDNFEELETEVTTSGILITPPLESILEDFLVNNLGELENGLTLYRDEDEIEGRQYPTDVGNIDLLCKDEKGNFVVIELKKGRESDRVIGQISRYMGWVKKRLCEGNKNVRGIIVVHKPTSRYPKDEKLEYATEANDYIELKYYEITLKFLKQ